MASAEIFRRTIWALLRLEWEVVKTTSERMKDEILNPTEGHISRLSNSSNILEDEEEMTPMAITSSVMIGGEHRRELSFFTYRRKFSAASLSDMSNMTDIQILSELCVWATIFCGVALIGMAHREVL